MITKLVTAPVVEPVSLSRTKDWIRVDISDDDTLIDSLITMARRHLERHLWRAFELQTWDVWLDDWPSGQDYIALPYAPLLAVTHVKYTDSDSDLNAFSTDYWAADTDAEPGRVVLEYDETWPTVTLHPKNPINIRYTCGYDDTEYTNQGDWATSTDYSVNDIVRSSGLDYVCTSAHTSGTFDDDSANWTEYDSNTPDEIKLWIKQAVGYMYDNREADLSKFPIWQLNHYQIPEGLVQG